MNWVETLKGICSKGKPYIIQGFADAMSECIRIADLNSPLRLEHFIAQCCEESDGLATTEEYASGHKYEGRHDLGNTHPGDGVKFKGRGILQITGRANYALYGHVLGVDFLGFPERMATFPYAAKVAALYWRPRAINIHADQDDIIRVTESVNGGLNGLAVRKDYLRMAKHVLGGLK